MDERRWTILGGDFTPTEDDVRAIEEALPGKLAEVGPSLVPKWHAPDPFWERLDDYRRQYSGVARPEGNVIIGNVVSKASAAKNGGPRRSSSAMAATASSR